MNCMSFFMRRLGACVAIFIISGCASSQIQTTPPASVQQSVVATGMQPAVDCPIVGKTYTRGGTDGQASMTFREAYSKAGPYESYLRVRLVYTHWRQSRPLIYKKLTLSTCGLESGKKPIGEVREGTGSLKMECVDGICTITLDFDAIYQPPVALGGMKKWKFDLLRFAPDKPTKAFEPLPTYRVVVSR